MNRTAVIACFFALAPVSGCKTKAAPSQSEKSAIQEAVDPGCGHQDGSECHHPSHPNQPSSAPSGKQLYGSPLGTSPEVALSAVLKEPEKYHDKSIKLSGYVSRACSRKGCWMEVATSKAPQAERCRVKFKDYGFFVPVDAAGSTAVLEGVVQVTRVKKAAVEHYESEGAQFGEKSKDGSAREIRIIATGVELTRS